MKIKLPLVAAAILSTASFNSIAAPAYRLVDLGVLAGGDFSYAYSISNTGVASGRSRAKLEFPNGDTVTSNVNAVRFYNGNVQDLGNLGAGRAEGRAVNDGGTVAGFSLIETADGSRQNQAFINKFKTGYTKNIGTLDAGKESRAYGINNNGKVVGWSNTKADGSDHVAFVYDMETDTMEALSGPMLGGARSFAFDINDKGQIAGTATTANGSAHAFSYENGVATDLGSLDDSGNAEARAINENGFVTGWSLTDSKDFHAFLYDGTGMVDLGSMGGDSKGYDVNIHGTVVGSSKDADGGNHAFLYQDGQMYDLYDLLSAEDQALWKELREGFSINDNGDIVGRGRFWTDKENDRSSSRAFMLTAVPVPGAIFLMGPAIAFLGFMGKRRTQV